MAKHGDKTCDAMFEDLYARVREYAQQRRLEELTRKSKGDPMDVGQLSQPGEYWTIQDEYDNLWVNALGKGKSAMKGKGKGKGMPIGASSKGGDYWTTPWTIPKGKGKASPECWYLEKRAT